jgi:phosphinothricin acetyltransferase
VKLRFAAQEDVPALLAVYSRYIPTCVTFEYTLPSREAFSQRVASISQTYPYLVIEEDGQLLGYAYAHRIAERAAYAWGAELSVYLHPDAAGRGLGKRLYQALMALLELQGVRTVYGLVASPNPASEGLHKSLGFHQSGVQKNAGYKNGRWIDLLWFEKAIGPYSLEPAPLIPIHALPPEAVQRILETA